MPRDEWKRATDRAKYGPVRYEKRRKKVRAKKKTRTNKRVSKTIWVYIIHIKTPAIVIRPNCTETTIETTKTLKFWKQAKIHLREGYHTFQRRGFYLIVEDKYVCRDTMKSVK